MTQHVIEGPKLRYFTLEKTLGEFFFSNFEKHSNRICQIDGTSNITETFKSVKLRSVRVALELQKRGITSKDVVTLCSCNTLDNTIPILAAAFLGAKVSNLESSLSVKHITHLLSLVTPKIIFVEESAVDLIEQSLKVANFDTEIIVFGKSQKYATFNDLVKPQAKEEEFRPSKVDPNDTVIIMFSSGTTGLPKAICHSHSSFLYLLNQTIQAGFRGRCLHFTNFYWITAMTTFLITIKYGAARVFCRNPTAQQIFEIISTYKVNGIFAATIQTYKMTSFPNPHMYDTSCLEVLMVGGTPTPPTQLQSLRNLFKNAFVTQGYGMSECGPVAFFDPDSDKELTKTKLASTGRPAPGSKMKFVDLNTEKNVGPYKKGEVRIKSPGVMIGHMREDFSSNFDEEGFLKTGDLGYYDQDYCVYLEGRIKEMFKYKSWHIVPSLIEQILLEHPEVQEAVVFGVPHEIDGEIPAACIVLKKDSKVDAKKIEKFLENKVADREKLRGGITFLKSLPKTPTGKISRQEIKNNLLRFIKC